MITREEEERIFAEVENAKLEALEEIAKDKRGFFNAISAVNLVTEKIKDKLEDIL